MRFFLYKLKPKLTCSLGFAAGLPLTKHIVFCLSLSAFVYGGQTVLHSGNKKTKPKLEYSLGFAAGLLLTKHIVFCLSLSAFVYGGQTVIHSGNKKINRN